MKEESIENKQLILIPKIEDYIEYMINVILKLPRTEKFNIGNEYKLSLYKMMYAVLYINKINRKKQVLEGIELLNKIDTELNCQRIYLRIMRKQKWIDIKKFDVSMSKIYEIGKIIGGLIKNYAKNNYDNLIKAHYKSRTGKGYRKEIILFNLKQEEYIKWLYEELKNGKYNHGGYTIFYITEPKLRKIEKSKYIDRIVHRWVVDNFIEPYFVPTFINTSYACLKNRGMHKACLDVQKAMRSCKSKWNNYYILKMDISKFFQNINKDILYN